MSDYTKTTDFEVKDSLPTGDVAKIIKGVEFEVEFDAISTAIATKADLESPTFTGTVTIPTLTLDATTVTSTGAELNILDGVTSTTAELNLVDGSVAGTIVNDKAVIYGSAGEVNSTTLQTVTLEIDGVAVTSTAAELNILDGVTSTTAELNILDGVTVNASQINDVTNKLVNVVEDTTPQLGGSLDVNGNSIVSASNGDIAIAPDGTGQIVLDGLNWPTADGVADYILKTDGAGNLSWVIQASVAAGEIVLDTTPQLGGDLDVNGNSIVSVSNGNINITPNGTGKLITTTAEAATIESDHFRLGNVSTGASGTTLSAGEMFVSTAATQTATLPASPTAGDTVYVAVQDFTDTVVGRNGENIMSTAEDMTIDTANLTLTFTYVNSTIGWRVY
jgi:hypothetical protein